MAEDFFLLDIPAFEPKYDAEKKYGWTKYKEELEELLISTSNGYCMYCYDKILINGQKIGQIEHGIEKMNSEKRLKDCVPNLSISCSICNEKYKRRGERKRKLPEASIKRFEEGECLKYDCKAVCGEFRRIREEYIKKGNILIQPFRFKNSETKHELKIQYDLLECKYVPYFRGNQYTEEENTIVENHIKQFGLNLPERRNFEIGRYCKNVVDEKSLLIGIKYNNLMVDLLREKLRKLDLKEAIKICEIIYYRSFSKLAT